MAFFFEGAPRSMGHRLRSPGVNRLANLTHEPVQNEPPALTRLTTASMIKWLRQPAASRTITMQATSSPMIALASCPSISPRRRSPPGTGDRRQAAGPSSPASFATPFDHPDAQRRFRVMANIEELQRALDFPWEKWTVFLHPDQREMVERDYTGPARVSSTTWSAARRRQSAQSPRRRVAENAK